MDNSDLTHILGGEMDDQDIEKRLLGRVDPNRRSFVKQILGGAAFVALLIAISLMAPEGARAACLVEPDTGYAGPSVFQAHLTDPTHTTHANGVATFVITANPPGTFSVKTAQIDYSLLLAPGVTFESFAIGSYGLEIADFLSKKGGIDAHALGSRCLFQEFLDGLDSEGSTIYVQVEVQGTRYTLIGTIKSVPPTVITLGP